MRVLLQSLAFLLYFMLRIKTVMGSTISLLEWCRHETPSLDPVERMVPGFDINCACRVKPLSCTFAGNFILRTRPTRVVLESAMSAEFGSATGNVLSASDADSSRADMVLFRVLFAVADALRKHTAPAESETWREVQTKMYGEQLAAIAALTVNADIVYGDTPKALTYKRLVHCCTARDLDLAFGRRSARNFREMLGRGEEPADGVDVCPVERVLMAEREAVLCHSACVAAEATGGPDGSVVVLVGAPCSCAAPPWSFDTLGL